LALAFVVFAGVPWLVQRIVRWRLAAMISTQLNASLEIGDLSYHYPYRVEVTDAVMVTAGPEGKPLELLRVPHLSLKLARLPFRSGPLAIESILIDQPAIHLIREREGLVGRRGLAKPVPPPANDSRKWKLSEMFQLRHLIINGGQIVYEDRSLAGTRPLVWKNLNMHLNTAQEMGSQYAFQFVADDAPLATLDAAGTADIDSFLLKLDRCSLAVNVDPSDKNSAIPPDFQEMLNSLGIRGSLMLNTRATLPVLELSRSTYDTKLEIRQARAKIPQSKTELNHFAAQLHITDSGGHPAIDLASLDATSDAGSLHLTGGSITLDPTKMDWDLKGLTGRIDAGPASPQHMRGSVEFSLAASGPLGLTDVKQLSADLHLRPLGFSIAPACMPTIMNEFAEADFLLPRGKGMVTARHVRAQLGNDVLYVKETQIDLTALPRVLLIKNADGAVTFGSPRATYPKVIEGFLTSIEPGGPWFFGGSANIGLAHELKTGYDVLARTRKGRFALNNRRLPIYNIDTAFSITPAAIEVLHFNAGSLGGQLQLTGGIKLSGQTAYDLTANLQGIDLKNLATAISDPKSKPIPLAGRGNALLHAAGIIPDDNRSVLDTLTASGEAEVKDGDFWRIPIMKSIADNSNVRTVLTVGEAAAVFTVSNGAVHLSHAAAGAPALGVEGAGDINFKGRLNIDCVTTVLGKWGDKFAVGDDGSFSRTVNNIQQALNGITQAVVVNIHIDGTANDPQPHPVVAPVITKATVDFVHFLKGKSQNGGLLGYEKKQPAPGGGK
jgi:hypothetical protein